MNANHMFFDHEKMRQFASQMFGGRKEINVTKEAVVGDSRPLDGRFDKVESVVDGMEVVDVNLNPKSPQIRMMFVPNIKKELLTPAPSSDTLNKDETNVIKEK